jgi:hypothetical protein
MIAVNAGVCELRWPATTGPTLQVPQVASVPTRTGVLQYGTDEWLPGVTTFYYLLAIVEGHSPT